MNKQIFKPLTASQSFVYQAILKHFSEFGHSPSLDEIGAACGYTSLATTHKHLRNLSRKGWLISDRNRARSIVLFDPQSKCCPMCGSKRKKPA